jgi:hypothetical protein
MKRRGFGCCRFLTLSVKISTFVCRRGRVWLAGVAIRDVLEISLSSLALPPHSE